MANFAIGQTVNLSLDYDDVVTWDGGGVATITNAAGATSNTTLTGRQYLGPYRQATTISVLATTAGSYTQASSVAVDSVVYNSGGSMVDGAGGIFALSEVAPYVSKTATGAAFSGACAFAGYVCTVAAGNITVYDNTSAAGTVIVPTTALAVGAFPIFGAGTNGKMALTTGCYVVLSDAATVNVLVG